MNPTDAATPDVAPPKVDCPKCLELAPNIEAPSRSVPYLRSWEEVLTLLGGKQLHSDHTHHISALLARYEVAPPMVACGLPDRTPHHWGSVIRTRCNVMLNIGHECAKKRLPEMADLIKADNEQKRHEERVVKMRGSDLACHHAETLRREVVLMTFFVDNLKAHAPSFAHELRRISRRQADDNVTFSRPSLMERRLIHETYVVVGTQLFDEQSHPDVDHIESQIAHVRDVVKEAGQDPTRDAGKRAYREIEALNALVKEAEQWAGQARRFFAPNNFSAALIVTKTTDVTLEGETLRTPDGYVIGLNGIRKA